MNKKTTSLSQFAVLMVLLLSSILFPQISAAGQTVSAKEVIEINTKADLVALLNRVHPVDSRLVGDQKRYGVADVTINLNADIEISSDDINSQFPENTLYTKYEHAFTMDNSSFLGNGHTITITQGTRRIYPLFEDLRVNDPGTDFVAQVEDLSLIYKGNVYGSGFARGIATAAWDGKTYHRIQKVNITVEGNILPISQKYWTLSEPVQYTLTRAAGFVQFVEGTEIRDINIRVTGDIGTLTPEKEEHAQSELIFSSSSGFIIESRSGYGDAPPQTVDNLTINVGGSILAAGKHYRAVATGLGSNLGGKKFTNVQLKVAKDIKAVAEGDSVFTRIYHMSDPNLASAVGQYLLYIENGAIHIGGDISAANNTNVRMQTYAAGIVDWVPWYSKNEADLQQNPLTIKKLSLTVGGSVKAVSAAPQYIDSFLKVVTRASPGFSYGLNRAFKYDPDFQDNTIKIQGDVIADSQEGLTVAELWGYFTGTGNDLSAKSLRAVSVRGTTIAAPFYHFLNGKNNTVTLTDGVFSQGTDAYVGGWAYKATQMDNLIDKNVMNVKSVTSDGTAGAGGFAYEIAAHEKRPDVNPVVLNTDIVLDTFDLGTSTAEISSIGGFVGINNGVVQSCSTVLPAIEFDGVKPYLGGFAGTNSGTIAASWMRAPSMKLKTNAWSSIGGFVGNNPGNVARSTADIGPITISGFGDIGGFVGYTGPLPVETSTANIESLTVNGNPTSSSNIGGFAGRQFGGIINDSVSFIRDSISAANSNNVNLGGFIGIGTDVIQNRNSAQIGENLTSTGNTGLVNIGGYAGYIQNIKEEAGQEKVDVSISNVTSLVFGNILGQTDEADEPSFSAGGIGVILGETESPVSNITVLDSASNVGGKIIAGNFTPFGGKNPVAGAVGRLINGTVTGYTVLADKVEAGTENRATPFNYIASFTNPYLFSNNYFVEVDLGSRIATPISLNDLGNFEQGASVGKIEIAPRAFQYKYWDASAEDPLNTYPYENFDYVIGNEAGIALNRISKDFDIVSADAATVTLRDFTHRHLAIWAGSGRMAGPVYDILGIKSGKFFSLTYVTNGGTVYPAIMHLQGREAVIDKVPVRNGFIFDGWYAEPDFITQLTTVLMDGNQTVYAKWSPEPNKPADPGEMDFFPVILPETGFPVGSSH
jgi:uncharacterized repeat protein (TIGR02543 family)